LRLEEKLLAVGAQTVGAQSLNKVKAEKFQEGFGGDGSAQGQVKVGDGESTTVGKEAKKVDCARKLAKDIQVPNGILFGGAADKLGRTGQAFKSDFRRIVEAQGLNQIAQYFYLAKSLDAGMTHKVRPMAASSAAGFALETERIWTVLLEDSTKDKIAAEASLFEIKQGR
jgi:hypothetical protein